MLGTAKLRGRATRGPVGVSRLTPRYEGAYPSPHLLVRTGAYRDAMAETTTGRIERELMDEPHIAGRRLSVLRIYDLVKGRGDSPETVASTFDLDLADVYRALAYYYDHPDEMRAIREDRERAFEWAKGRAEADRPAGVEPPE